MKLLEEDEVRTSFFFFLLFYIILWNFRFSVSRVLCLKDETMHSGADVEAFQAALNRDIGGDVSTSQPSDSSPGAYLIFHSTAF